MNIIEQIRMYAQRYYDGFPEISDSEFDALVTLAKEQYPTDPIWNTVGFGYSPKIETHLKKFEHFTFCGSLPKIFEQDINTQFSNSEIFVVMPKLDGGSAEAQYVDGQLHRVITRGDGYIGLDITENVKHSGTIPLKINQFGKVSIKGELVISMQSFNILGGQHPRNRAVGLSVSKHSIAEDLKHLQFIAYGIENVSENKLEELSQLVKLGFKTVNFDLVDLDTFQKKVSSSQYSLKNSLISKIGNEDFPIDGLVLKALKKPAIAYKFETETAISKVVNIEWNLSKSGRYIPVLEIEPTYLSGALISNITANNYTYLQKFQCGIGSTIEFSRSNEVIPHLLRTVNPMPISAPTHCTSCNEPLSITPILSKTGKQSVDLMCLNESCDCRTDSIIFNCFKNWATHGIGAATINAIIERYELNSISRLIDFVNQYRGSKISREELISISGKAQASKIKTMLDGIAYGTLSVGTLLSIANIKGFGSTCVKTFNDQVSVDSFLSAINSRVVPNDWNVLFPSYVVFQDLQKNLQKILYVCKIFKRNQFINIEKTTANTGIKVCITGTLSVPRKQLETEWANLGIESVSIESANVLVCDALSSSSKYKKAVSKGIPIMTEQEFKNTYIKSITTHLFNHRESQIY